MFINWALLKHPMNWFTVTLMVLIAAITAHFLINFEWPAAAKNAKKIQ